MFDTKPCPFCGSDKVQRELFQYSPIPDSKTTDYYFYRCDDCMGAGPHAVSPITALILWNNRSGL